MIDVKCGFKGLDVNIQFDDVAVNKGYINFEKHDQKFFITVAQFERLRGLLNAVEDLDLEFGSIDV